VGLPDRREERAQGTDPGPQGPLLTRVLECSNGQQDTVLVDPSGSHHRLPDAAAGVGGPRTLHPVRRE